MKMLIQIIIMILLAVLVIVFIYPVMHEGAHALVSLFCDAKVLHYQVFPIAKIVISSERCSRLETIVIMLSGATVPTFALMLPPSGSYYIYYIKLVVALISASNAFTSMINVLGQAEEGYDDAVRLLIYYPDARSVVIIVLVLQLAVSLLFCVFSKPLNKMSELLLK